MQPHFSMNRLTYLCAVVFLTAATVPAQTFKNSYHTYDEMTAALNRLGNSHRNIVAVQSLAKTIQKRDVWAVTIGGRGADDRHALLVVGGVEANRLIGSELALRLIEHLITNYGKIDSITRLVDATTFYILPRVNPDAAEGFFQKPRTEKLVNARPVDDDKDGAIDEDGPDDLNGDGLLTMMRVTHEGGEWMIHPDDARLLKKADPTKGERGAYRLYTEGVDNDKDEQWNEDPQGGVDFNRNFPHNYAFFGQNAGPHQLSEMETRMVADFCFAHPNIGAVFTFASNENLLTAWKGEKGKSLPSSSEGNGDEEEPAPSRLIKSVMEGDQEYYSWIGKMYQDMTGLKGAPRSGKNEGDFAEWAYYHFGRWSFVANPWWISFAEEKDTAAVDGKRKKGDGDQGKTAEEKSDAQADQLKALRWIDQSQLADRFVPWTRVKHPDFPDRVVEVGGFTPFAITNPPADSIHHLAEKNNRFITALAGLLPSVEVRSVEVEPVGDRVYRVKGTIANAGYLPTNSAMGVKAAWPRNVKVVLKLEKNQTLSGGKSILILDPIKGSGGLRELEWLIVSPPGGRIEITAESPMTGRSTKIVTLK